MSRIQSLGFVLALSVFTTACASVLADLRLEGLESISGQTGSDGRDRAAGQLRKLADQAELAARALDIVQIENDAQGNLFIAAIFAPPASADDADLEVLLQRTVEAIWEAAIEYAPDSRTVTVAFMRAIPVNTLDRGTARVGLLIGSVTVQLPEAAAYLGGTVTAQDRAAFWGGGTVQTEPLSQTYNGTPNHPIRPSSS